MCVCGCKLQNNNNTTHHCRFRSSQNIKTSNLTRNNAVRKTMKRGGGGGQTTATVDENSPAHTLTHKQHNNTDNIHEIIIIIIKLLKRGELGDDLTTSCRTLQYLLVGFFLGGDEWVFVGHAVGRFSCVCLLIAQIVGIKSESHCRSHKSSAIKLYEVV